MWREGFLTKDCHAEECDERGTQRSLREQHHGNGVGGVHPKRLKKKTFTDRMRQMKSEKLRAGGFPKDTSGHPHWTAQWRHPRNHEGECLNAGATIRASPDPRRATGAQVTPHTSKHQHGSYRTAKAWPHQGPLFVPVPMGGQKRSAVTALLERGEK